MYALRTYLAEGAGAAPEVEAVVAAVAGGDGEVGAQALAPVRGAEAGQAEQQEPEPDAARLRARRGAPLVQRRHVVPERHARAAARPHAPVQVARHVAQPRRPPPHIRPPALHHGRHRGMQRRRPVARARARVTRAPAGQRRGRGVAHVSTLLVRCVVVTPLHLQNHSQYATAQFEHTLPNPQPRRGKLNGVSVKRFTQN
jgi:hypothetical protein